MSDVLTACYGRPVEGQTTRTWWGPEPAVEHDTVRPSSLGEQLWLRWYPIPETEVVAVGIAVEGSTLEAEQADILVPGA